jgi:N-acetylmuramoyl-L-alanine amidase
MERQMYLKINQYTNPGIKNKGVFGLVWHYTASPGASANNIARYFNGTCIVSKRYASAHDAIDEKEVVNMIPYNLIAYHAHDRSRQQLDRNRYGSNANFTTLGMELCIDKNGNLLPATYENAVKHGAKLCKMFNLDPIKHNHRHFDVTSKNCPAFWVSNPAGFEKFKMDIAKEMNKSKTSSQSKEDSTLDLGDKGNGVKELQIALNKLGYNCGTPDGDFGKKTDLAVEMFQRANGLVVDGVVGAATRKKIEEKLKEKQEVKKPVIKEEDDKLELKPYMWEMAKENIKKRVDAKKIDSQWLSKVEKKELTQSELAWLLLELLSRHEEESCCCCKK